MCNKEIANKGKQQSVIRISTLYTIILIFSIILSTGNTITNSTSTLRTSTNLSSNEKVVQERFIDDDYHYPLSTLELYRNSIMRLNISVLSSSYSNVEVYPDAALYAQQFSPILTNFTLSPGESFVEDYTFIVGYTNDLEYECRLTLPNSTATVQWWYEVLYSAKPDDAFIGIEVFFVSVSFIVSGIAFVYISKRKSIKKE